MTPWTARDTFDVLRIGSLKHFLRRLAGPAPLAPASPAAGPASPRALAGRPARRPRPPARPAARRRAVAHGLDRHRCWGGDDFKGDSTRISKGILHAQRGERHLRCAHIASETTRDVVGLGNPIERCLASTGRGKRRWDGGQLAMTQDARDDRLLGNSSNNTERAASAKGTGGHIQRKHAP
jgi:hypothetical protein